MAKNPPPAPLLQSLGDTPQKQREIQELRMFLILLWEQLGGGSDRLDELSDADSGGTLLVVVDALKKRANQMETLLENQSRLQSRISQLENLTHRPVETFRQLSSDVDQLRRKINEMELS